MIRIRHLLGCTVVSTQDGHVIIRGHFPTVDDVYDALDTNQIKSEDVRSVWKS